MDDRHHKGARTGIDSNSSRLLSLLSVPDSVSRIADVKRIILKNVALPVGVLSSSFLFSKVAFAAEEGHRFGKPPVKAVTDKMKGSLVGDIEPVKAATEFYDKIEQWFQDLPHHIAEWSVNLMSSLYELCSTLILQTPLWIFDNEWFHNTTHEFSLLCIGIVTVLTALEGIKRMLPASLLKKGKSSQPMDMKDIVKRWAIVSGGMAFIPFLFKKGFEGLNFVSSKLVEMGASTMQNLTIPDAISLFDVLVLVTFDAVLIGTIVPLLWRNGRRFFDIMVLGVSTPFALTAWIFDSYRHLYRQWWENLKTLSLVQVYYSMFLLILGWFLYGVPTPASFTGMIVKFLVVIGGFARMVNPPRVMSKHFDMGGGFDEVTTTSARNTINKVKESYRDTKDIVTGPAGFANMARRKLTRIPSFSPQPGSQYITRAQRMKIDKATAIKNSGAPTPKSPSKRKPRK